MKYLKLLEIQPGGWLLLSVLYFFGDASWLCVILGNALVHELGHLYAIEKLGGRVYRITLGMTGFCIYYNDFLFHGPAKAAIAAAGPVCGLLVSGCASALGHYWQVPQLFLFAGVGLVLSVFNLLPAKPLDGWGILHSFFPSVAQIVGVCTVLIIFLIGLTVMYLGYGVAPAVMGIVLLVQDAPIGKRFRK